MRSFEIDHRKLVPGIYKHSVSGVVTTWDVRIKIPNGKTYLNPAVIHTVEHTLATYLRDRYGNYRIVGIFPMGCQTGFYVLTRFIGRNDIYGAIVDYINCLERMFTVPGCSEAQCGNYELHDLGGAKKVMREYMREWLSAQSSARNYK